MNCVGGLADTVGVSTVRGGILDVSFAGGSLRVDAARNAEAYGPGVAPAAILDGTVDPPPEMQARAGGAGGLRVVALAFARGHVVVVARSRRRRMPS